MYPMMPTTGWNYVFITLWGLHIVSVIAFFAGVLFLILLAIKTFTPAQLRSWAVWLMVIGTIVCLFTIAIIGRPWIGLYYWGTGMGDMQMPIRQAQGRQQMGQMMEMMMEHNQGADNDERREHGDMMQMMRMMMEKRMMGTSDIGSPDDLTGSNSSSAILDEQHENSSSLSR